jgi:hypothetical protein
MVDGWRGLGDAVGEPGVPWSIDSSRPHAGFTSRAAILAGHILGIDASSQESADPVDLHLDPGGVSARLAQHDRLAHQPVSDPGHAQHVGAGFDSSKYGPAVGIRNDAAARTAPGFHPMGGTGKPWRPEPGCPPGRAPSRRPSCPPGSAILGLLRSARRDTTGPARPSVSGGRIRQAGTPPEAAGSAGRHWAARTKLAVAPGAVSASVSPVIRQLRASRRSVMNAPSCRFMASSTQARRVETSAPNRIESPRSS